MNLSGSHRRETAKKGFWEEAEAKACWNRKKRGSARLWAKFGFIKATGSFSQAEARHFSFCLSLLPPRQ
jgi:hypothetical protein